MLFAFIYFFLNSYAYWTQVGETISQTTDSYVNQPGWIVSSSGSLNSFIFQKNCSKSITLEKGSYQSTKRIQLTEDSSLLHFSFNEIEVYCKLIANSEYFPNVFILSFIGTRSYPADGYETEIEIYDKSFTIITETNSEHFLFKFKDNNNPYLLINASVTNTIIIDISGFDLNGLETKYLFSFSRIAPTISLIYRNGKLVTDYNARYYSAFNRYFLKKITLTNAEYYGACLLKDLDTHRTSGGFNYPDCVNRSSLFKLRNIDTYEDIIIDSDQSYWREIIPASTTLLNIYIEDSRVLKIIEQDMETKRVAVIGKVIIETLNVRTENLYYFEDFEITTMIKIPSPNVVKFYGNSNSFDPSTKNLKQFCNSRYVYNTYNAFSCDCKYTMEYDHFDFNYLQYKSFTQLNLVLSSNENTTEPNKGNTTYWNQLIIGDSIRIIENNYIVNECDFSNKTITINGNLNCKSLHIDESTRIIVNGKLTIDKLTSIGEFEEETIFPIENTSKIISCYSCYFNDEAFELKETRITCLEINLKSQTTSSISFSNDLLLNTNNSYITLNFNGGTNISIMLNGNDNILYFNNTSTSISLQNNGLTNLLLGTITNLIGFTQNYNSFNDFIIEISENQGCTVCNGILTNNQFCGCDEGYYPLVNECFPCSNNCKRCNSLECFGCNDVCKLTDGYCIEVIVGFYSRELMLDSNEFSYLENNECLTCPDDCIICSNSTTCLLCNETILTNNKCIPKSIGDGNVINEPISCLNGYYSNNSQCIDCSLTFDNCEICDINGCLSCSNGVIINNGSCSLNTNCLNVDNSICLNCNDNGSWFNGNECIECGDNCKNCINGYCIECNDGYILQNQNNCIDTNEYPDNCITLSYYGTCQRCSDGYYLNNNLCYECSNECITCHNSTYCFSCNDGYMLNDNECVDMSESNANCKTAIPGSSRGCAICNDGYYRNQTTCISCISNCNKCNNDKSCLICESNYFLLNDASKCISYDDLTNCETPTQSGCSKCNDTYYLNNQYCTSCSDTTENCNTCNNNGKCLTCQNGYILINYECINYQLIDNCKESSDSKCTSCSFWHTLNSNQTGCDTQAEWWVIVLIVLFILVIFIGICALIVYFIFKYKDYKRFEKQRIETTIFDMKTSNVQFKSTNNKDVVINKDEILFNDESEEIGVNEETRDLICVGNTSKHTIKVQFSVKDGCDKYEIRTNPQLITIPKGKAIEFEIFIKPLCTCKINDQIMLISVDLTKGKTITTPITINTITIMTTHLDYSELIEDIKLGEGGFGIVYKGTFRANQVAIKKIKQLNNKQQMEEFNNEVAMLDKFRNEYIVHFYGAVFISNKICMVTEFAQYGSLQDLINKTKDNPIDNIMKILLDCSKNISYLHSNGILHRDIKPDNFLVLSLQNDVQVHAKLTDFGSSRNTNMLMTNMTFTKGIGTPVYMAPEVLNKKKYKKSADIYSFAMTIYETIIWNEAYTLPKFKFPWNIAEFAASGERLLKPTTMNETIYSLIDNCWKQEPQERYEIEEVIEELEKMI